MHAEVDLEARLRASASGAKITMGGNTNDEYAKVPNCTRNDKA